MEILISLFVLQIIFFVVSIILSVRKYKAINKIDYSFRNTFPYEFNFYSFFKDNAAGNVAAVFSSFLSIAFYSCLLNSRIIGNSVLIVVTGILTAVMSLVVLFVPLKLLKTHITFSVILFASTFALFGSLCYVNIDFYGLFKEVSYMVIGIISAIIGIFIFCLLMNPRLSIYIKMTEQKNDDGTISYIRPKWFMMAFTEWVCIFANLVAGAIALATFLVVNL